MVYSIIQKSQLEGAHRIDGEYYQPEYLEIHRKINLLGSEIKLLRDVIEEPVVTGSTPKARDCKGDGSDIHFIKTDTLRDGEIVFEDADCLSMKSSKKYSEPHYGDVLVTVIGATYDIVGRSAMVFADDPTMNINQNIALIRINSELVLPSFLATFLQSKFGRDQLWQQSRQTEQVNLNCREVELVRIPLFSLSSQKSIDDLIILSRKLKNDSIILYKQAEDLLLEELGLRDFQVEDDLSFIVNLSDVKSANRVDAEYFQPKYEKLISKIKEKNAKLLGDLVSMKKGFEPGSEAYQEEGKLFIRVSSVSKFGIDNKDQKYLSNDLYQKLKNNFQLQLGEILLTKDATPGIAYVIKESIEGIISGGILRLKLKENIDSEYLALCISSLIGQMQAERDSGGSVIVHWKPEQIKKLLIPILPKDPQREIGDLVRKSHEARKKSKELLEEAKRKVEDIIENG